MGVEEIIKTIKEEDLLAFFFELESGYLVDYEHYTSEDEMIETQEQEDAYLKKLGLSNFENKGGRADTSEFWNVVYFPDYDVYLKISGWYDSYGGYEHSYDEIEAVTPKTVTKTIYN